MYEVDNKTREADFILRTILTQDQKRIKRILMIVPKDRRTAITEQARKQLVKQLTALEEIPETSQAVKFFRAQLIYQVHEAGYSVSHSAYIAKIVVTVLAVIAVVALFFVFAMPYVPKAVDYSRGVIDRFEIHEDSPLQFIIEKFGNESSRLDSEPKEENRITNNIKEPGTNLALFAMPERNVMDEATALAGLSLEDILNPTEKSSTTNVAVNTPGMSPDNPDLRDMLVFDPLYRNRITIPALKVDSPVYGGTSIDFLEKGTWLRPNGSTPDKGGNTVIVGHRYTSQDWFGKNTFYDLPDVEVGDLIEVVWEGKEYVYKIFLTDTVKPDAVEIEAPSSENILTIYTCTPLWSGHNRFVVKARLITS